MTIIAFYDCNTTYYLIIIISYKRILSFCKYCCIYIFLPKDNEIENRFEKVQNTCYLVKLKNYMVCGPQRDFTISQRGNLRANLDLAIHFRAPISIRESSLNCLPPFRNFSGYCDELH